MRYLYTLAFVGLCFFIGYAQSPNSSTTQAILQQKIQEDPTAYHTIYILLEDQLNVRLLEEEFQREKTKVDTRRATVVSALQEKASISQKGLLAYLRHSDAVLSESIRSYWAANVIFLEAKKEAISALSNHPEVAWVGYNGSLSLVESTTTAASAAAPDGIEPGLQAINAPALWAMGYTGHGRLAFVNDTGVDPDHPAYWHKYLGHHAERSQAWFDYITKDTNPRDCGDHGTHVLGTMLGLDPQTRDTVGVAFNAQWIGGTILCGLGTEDNLASFEWSMTLDQVPDVINNSWRDPDLVGDTDCTSLYVPLFENMEAAGIAVIFSAGNDGPDPGTITPPHNINFDTLNAFTVGALGIYPPHMIADFSSHGPSHCGGEGSLLIKPEVSAPGVNVRSCGLDNTYNQKSGTSMAAPHVAGAILLLKEAFPYLTGRDLKRALYHSCTDLGFAGEDNVYGMGMINVLEAYNFLIAKGHTPVPPVVASNDIILLKTEIRRIECGGVIDPAISFFNNSVDTIYTFDIMVEVGETQFSYNWEGVLLPNATEEWAMPEMTLPTSEILLSITIDNPNGQVDTHPYNNKITNEVTIIQEVILPEVAYAEDYSFCDEAPILLQVDYEGNGTVKWYDEEEDSQPIGEGTQWTTPVSSDSTTFYADVVFNPVVGPKNYTNEPSASEDQIDRGLLFDVHRSCILKSVKIYYEQGGGRGVTIYNRFGNSIFDETYGFGGSGEIRIDINAELGAGENYGIFLTQGRPLIHNTSGANFPYTDEDGIVTIKSSFDDSLTSDTEVYYYFYDWELEYTGSCGRQAVLVDVVSADNTPEAAFATSVDTVDIQGSTLVQFEDQSVSAVEWLWDFGDGVTSTDQNPTHTYETVGTKYVSLTVLNEEACASAVTYVIEVIDGLVSVNNTVASQEFMQIYPNPVQDVLVLNYLQKNTNQLHIRLFDRDGRIVLQQHKTVSPKGALELDVNELPTGVYYIFLEDQEGERYAYKVVKL